MYGHPHHIPQPPHSAGKPYSGLRARIHPEQIPSPIDSVEADDELWSSTTYSTLPGHHVPLASTNYVAVDQGNSTPRFIRLTTWNLPSTSALASSCQIPIAAIIQPFADPDPREEDVPVIPCVPSGPARCKHCRAYVNPWCSWTAGGNRWKCNLCEHETEVDPDYFCNLDANGLRLDHLQRAELNKGTVDFDVPASYWAPYPPPRIAPSYATSEPPPPPSATRSPEPLHVLFLIDVSAAAVAAGYTAASCAAIRSALYGASLDDGPVLDLCFSEACQVAVMTFDDVLHFYKISPEVPQASMHVVPDVEDVFCPLRSGMFAAPKESRKIIEGLLEALPHRFINTHSTSSAIQPAVRASLASLATWGGHVLLFHSLSTVLTPSEKKDTDPSWSDLGEECAEAGVGVSAFLSSHMGGDLQAIAPMPTLTGGTVAYFPRFDAARDSESVQMQLRGVLGRMRGYNCAVRVRCSNGLRIQAYHGSCAEPSSSGSPGPGVLSADHAFSAVLAHTRALDERHYAFVQCAVLYTSVGGARRVRVLNLAVQVAGLAGNVFRYADLDAVVTHFAKEAVSLMATSKVENIREELTEHCAALLLAYRRNCAASTAPSQLILPEAFKLLPLYALALQKSKALKEHNVPADVRHYHAHRLLALSARATMQFLYPRVLALHDLTPDIAMPPADAPPAESARLPALRLPSLMRASHLFMEAHGIYLVDNGEVMIMWVGADVAPQLLQDLFTVGSIHDIDVRSPRVEVLPTLLSAQLHHILAHRTAERGGLPARLFLARQNMDATEIEFSDMLVEDTNNGAMSYVDYLCLVHKQINLALTNGTSIIHGSSGLGMRGAPW